MNHPLWFPLRGSSSCPFRNSNFRSVLRTSKSLWASFVWKATQEAMSGLDIGLGQVHNPKGSCAIRRKLTTTCWFSANQNSAFCAKGRLSNPAKEVTYYQPSSPGGKHDWTSYNGLQYLFPSAWLRDLLMVVQHLPSRQGKHHESGHSCHCLLPASHPPSNMIHHGQRGTPGLFGEPKPSPYLFLLGLAVWELHRPTC